MTTADFTTIDATKLDSHAVIMATFRKSGKVWQEPLYPSHLFNILEMLRVHEEGNEEDSQIENRRTSIGVLLSDNETVMEYEVEINE